MTSILYHIEKILSSIFSKFFYFFFENFFCLISLSIDIYIISYKGRSCQAFFNTFLKIFFFFFPLGFLSLTDKYIISYKYINVNRY
nr:MAG TPA: hypothetical protein [Caudoviricetes sp.]